MSLARRRQTRVCAAPSATPSSPAISAPEYSYTYFSVNSRLSAGLQGQHGGPHPVPRQGAVRTAAAFHQDVLLQGEAGPAGQSPAPVERQAACQQHT